MNPDTPSMDPPNQKDNEEHHLPLVPLSNEEQSDVHTPSLQNDGNELKNEEKSVVDHDKIENEEKNEVKNENGENGVVDHEKNEEKNEDEVKYGEHIVENKEKDEPLILVKNQNVETKHENGGIDTNDVNGDSDCEDFDDEKSGGEIESNGKLIGIANDGSRFIIPTTKPPMGFPSLRNFKPYEWIRMIAFLYLIPLTISGAPRMIYVFLFVFWRIMYNVGLGWILWKQSNTRFLSKFFTPVPGHPMNDLIKKFLSALMEDDYEYDKCPPEFNAWLFFRVIVEVVLSNDLLCYVWMSLSYIEIPSSISLLLGLQYFVGLILCFFALWAKYDAYVVVKDFAWYWGDFFFLVDQKLTFSRVFAIFPHPMYTLGYMFFYGASIITQSYLIFYISLLAHFSQLVFLSAVEDPHIDKTYGTVIKEKDEVAKQPTTYFRRDLIVFKNFNILRSSDFFMMIIIIYNVVLLLLNVDPIYYIAQVIIWRLLHSGVLGTILYFQWKKSIWTNKFIKLGLTKHEAFEEWKRIFNLSLTINYVVFICCAVRVSELDITDIGAFLLKVTLGLILIAINIWSSVSTFEVIGESGWFYGDYFVVDEVESKIFYTGIYRFLNNPENVTGFAGYYGVAIISSNWALIALALFSQICNYLFCKYVDTPHMKEIYGDNIRNVAGVEEGVKEIIQHEALNFELSKKKYKERRDSLTKIVREKKNKLTQKVKEQKEEITQKVLEKKEDLEKLTQKVKETKEDIARNLHRVASSGDLRLKTLKRDCNIL